MERLFMTVEDIAADLSLSGEEAADLVKELRRRLEAAGKYVIPGRIPAVWYERQKARGFINTGEPQGRITLVERRLLSIEEFCEYAGGIGARLAKKHIKEIGADVRIGERLLVDRVKFDAWCDSYHSRK